jgi:hypothetical protein
MTLPTNRQRGLSRKRIVAHGKPGAGKTTLAGTLAPNWPGHGNKRWTKLEKTLWCSFDENATNPLLEHRCEVAELDWYTFPDLLLREKIVDQEQLDGLDDLDLVEAMFDRAVLEVGSWTNGLLVVDTFTALDSIIFAWWQENGPKTTGGKKDTFTLWRNTVRNHDKLRQKLSRLGCDVVWLGHSKPRSDSDSSEKKGRAQSLAGRFTDIRFDVSYEDVANIYRQHNDFVFVVDMESSNKGDEYWIYTEEYEGFEGKSRFRNIVPAKAPADLGEVYRQLEESLK